MTKKTELTKTNTQIVADKTYLSWLSGIKAEYRTSQIKAAIRVNSEMLEFYWRLGKEIVSMQQVHKWGSGLIEQLSLDLKAEFAQSGFSTTNLWYMRKWFLFYAGDEFLYQLGGENTDCAVDEIPHQLGGLFPMPKDFAKIPWRHHTEILSRSKTPEEGRFYIKRTAELNWSRKELIDFIESDLYEREGKAVTNFKDTLPTPQGKLAEEILKDPYDFDFLQLKQGFDERQLEDALCNDISRFLLELGAGFAFVGRQVELVVGEKSYFIDMLFYHIKLKCYVEVELKVVDFQPEFAGKLNFYVNAVDNLLKSPDDAPTIGLLICKSKDDTTVKWSFDGIEKPLGVAAYQIKQFVENASVSFRPTVGSGEIS